jgi:hypothetical protein
MGMSGLTRLAIAALTGLLASMTWSAPAGAEVDCRNGYYCPAGNACLKGGL